MNRSMALPLRDVGNFFRIGRMDRAGSAPRHGQETTLGSANAPPHVRSLKLRGAAMECRAEGGSDQLKCADRGNRDQRGDEAVFNCGRPILVIPQLHQGGKHSSSPGCYAHTMGTKACQSLKISNHTLPQDTRSHAMMTICTA